MPPYAQAVLGAMGMQGTRAVLGEWHSSVMGPLASLGLGFLIYKMDTRAVPHGVAGTVVVYFIVKMMVMPIQVSLPC